MKEYPILFNTEMVKAIQEGRKTMTRRVIKPQPEYIKDAYRGWMLCTKKQDTFIKSFNAGLYLDICPYGQVGDRLRVRETWCMVNTQAQAFISGHAEIVYKQELDAAGKGLPEEFTWKPSIHMNRGYSRILLEITGIRAERVQDISEEDAIAEGVNGGCLDCGQPQPCKGINPNPSFIDSFIYLWDSINAKPKPVYNGKRVIDHYISYPWEDIHEERVYRGKLWIVCGNPWNWAIEFKGAHHG